MTPSADSTVVGDVSTAGGPAVGAKPTDDAAAAGAKPDALVSGAEAASGTSCLGAATACGAATASGAAAVRSEDSVGGGANFSAPAAGFEVALSTGGGAAISSAAEGAFGIASRCVSSIARAGGAGNGCVGGRSSMGGGVSSMARCVICSSANSSASSSTSTAPADAPWSAPTGSDDTSTRARQRTERSLRRTPGAATRATWSPPESTTTCSLVERGSPGAGSISSHPQSAAARVNQARSSGFSLRAARTNACACRSSELVGSGGSGPSTSRATSRSAKGRSEAGYSSTSA